MVMDASRKYSLGSKAATFTVAIIFFLTFLSFKSVSAVSSQVTTDESFFEIKTRVGSGPPNCTNKCGNCKPCSPVLVRDIPPNQNKKGLKAATDNAHQDDAEYYPLVWKCQCGNKYYNP